MAGLIARLFGGKQSPAVDMNPLPGLGGYDMPPGPDGATGFPGSTSQTRTFKGNNPRTVGLRADSNSGITNVSAARAIMQSNPVEFYGGPPLHTRPGDLTAGGNPLSPAQQAGGHSVRDTETPPVERQPEISGDVPGSGNVRNTIAQRYKAVPGEMHTYMSRPRADQAPVNPGGQATDGNVHPDRVFEYVTVPSRFVFDGGGVQSWSVERRMPYTGRGDGARGADLNGQRYYGAGQYDQFVTNGAGQYGIGRLQGKKQPVSFTMPAPWASSNYISTDEVESGTSPQTPSVVNISPQTGRASNNPGYRNG